MFISANHSTCFSTLTLSFCGLDIGVHYKLAHKKNQYHKLGNEKNNVEIIQQYRAELGTLKDKALA